MPMIRFAPVLVSQTPPAGGPAAPTANLLNLQANVGITTGATFTWVDQSAAGNDATMATAANQPTDNGTSGVAFDGSDGLTLANSFDCSADWTKIVRFTLTNNKTFHNIWCTEEENAGDMFWVSAATGDHLVKSGSGAIYAQVSATTDLATDGTVYTYAMTVEDVGGGDGDFEVFNVTSGTAVSEDTATAANKSSDTTTTDTIGNFVPGNGNGLQGAILEVRGFDSILTPAEIEAVVATF